MIKQIKLTKDIINVTENEYGYFVSVFFCKFDKEKADQLKQQILENQEFAIQYKQQLKELQKTSNDLPSIKECDKITKQMWNDRQAAQKLEKITELEKLDESDRIWKRKLEKIPKDNQMNFTKTSFHIIQ